MKMRRKFYGMQGEVSLYGKRRCGQKLKDQSLKWRLVLLMEHRWQNLWDFTLLSKVTKILPESGLYRDDGAGLTKATGPQVSRLEKKLHKAFKDEGLKITTEVNIKKIDFLDFEMCLNTGTLGPYGPFLSI